MKMRKEKKKILGPEEKSSHHHGFKSDGYLPLKWSQEEPTPTCVENRFRAEAKACRNLHKTLWLGPKGPGAGGGAGAGQPSIPSP
jgi:hypothetical protein